MQQFHDVLDFINSVYDGPYLDRGIAPPKKIIIPYEYPVTFAVAAGISSTQQLAIQANSDFVHLRTAVTADVAAAAQTVANVTYPLATILIVDSGTNEQFMNTAVPIGNYATKMGPVAPESDHPFPRIIAGRTTLTITIASYEAANTNNIRISLQGVLVRVLG